MCLRASETRPVCLAIGSLPQSTAAFLAVVGLCLPAFPACEYRSNPAWTVEEIVPLTYGSTRGDGKHQGVKADKLRFKIDVTDSDEKRCCGEEEWESFTDDTRTITWSVTNGRVVPETGPVTTWVAPDVPGQFTLTATVVDDNSPAGTSDGTQQKNITVYAINIVDAKVVYTEGYCQASSDPDYPYQGDDVNVRLVVQAHDVGSPVWYCDMAFSASSTWYRTGTDGYREGTKFSFDSETFTESVTTPWPTDWPDLDGIAWTSMTQYLQDNASCGRYKYNQSSFSGFGVWGVDDFAFGQGGIGWHRYKALAKGDYYVQQRSTIPESDPYRPDKTTRFCIKSTTIADRTSETNRTEFLEWLSTYLDVPYEWGGCWYGGRYSGETSAGCGGANDGYGCDCSGLISCGAKRAGAEWNPWRQGTSGIDNVTEEKENWDDVEAGDIFNDPGHHVMAIVDWEELQDGKVRYYCIEETPRMCQLNWYHEDKLTAYTMRVVVDEEN